MESKRMITREDPLCTIPQPFLLSADEVIQ